MNNFHTPVLLQEVLEFLRIEKGKKYIDATIGGGGHSFEILKRGGIVLGIDCDEE
ncbi:MAG: 16S rRNA (cytosine(1402)-N(4))-methyltransferase, partial [Candidatus Levybacteria bacterium]|nr:16S rRNA (cytosine(1402)-N(4))-methyltransferase [Candidatus Levybacteria bacterium]